MRAGRTLDALNLIGVEEQLEDVGRPCGAAERPEVGGLVDPDQEVRVVHPAVVLEAPLMEDLATVAHSRLGRGGAFRRRPICVQREDVAPVGAQLGQDLVLVAPAALELQIVVGWRLVLGPDLAALIEQVEVRAVLAAEEVVEPAGGRAVGEYASSSRRASPCRAAG